MRKELRIPAYLLTVKLNEEQLEELEEKMQELAEEFQERARRRIEEGSEYSSDYEEIEISEYVTTDGEDNKEEKQIAVAKKRISKANILVETELRHSGENQLHQTGFIESNEEIRNSFGTDQGAIVTV